VRPLTILPDRPPARRHAISSAQLRGVLQHWRIEEGETEENARVPAPLPPTTATPIGTPAAVYTMVWRTLCEEHGLGQDGD
jgi:hypothetical protein